MKEEIEKIMRKGLRDYVSRSHYISDKSLDNKVTKILQLVNSKIDSAEDEIMNELYKNCAVGKSYAKDILSIIKQKVGE
jgi:hypothetical protein